MIRSHGDTTSYSADRLATAATYTLEDLIKRIPALQVDKLGVIRFNDKPIQGVHIEGMNMLGGRYAIATKNLKAEDIASIDLIERFQKMKYLRGKEKGDGTILNIHLKAKSRLRPVGELQGFGGALDDQPQEALYGAKGLAFTAQPTYQGMLLLGGNHGSEPIASEGLGHQGQDMLGLSPFRGEVRTEAIGGQTNLGLSNLGATVNGIHQLGDDDKTLRYNLGYSTSRLETVQSREVRQLDQGATTSYSEQDRQQGRRHLGQGILDYSANTSKSYFHEELTLNLNNQYTERALMRQGLAIGQQARAQSYHLQSATHWSRPTSEGSHLDLEGQLYLDAHPRLQFSSPTPGLAFSSQLAGYGLRFSTALAYSLQLGGRWGLGGRLNFLGHYGQLTAEELLPASAPYQVRGGGLQIDTSPSLSYQGSLTTFSCSFPLSWIIEGYRYGTASTRQTSPLVRLYPGIALQLNHNFSAGLKVVLQTSYQATLSRSLTTYLLTPVRLSFDRISERREAEHLTQRSLRSQITCYWRLPLEGFHSSFSVGWRRSFSPYSTVEDLQALQHLQGRVRSDSQQDTYSATVSLAKLFDAINTTCSLSSSFTWTSRPIIRQGARLISQAGGYELRPTLSLAPWEWISLDVEGACQVNLLRTPYYQSRSTRWSFSPELTLHAWRYWYLSLSHEAQWSDLPAGTSHPCHLLEASLRYQGRRWTVKLSGENLLNAHSQVSSFYSALDETLQQIRLRPRALLLSLFWRY